MVTILKKADIVLITLLVLFAFVFYFTFINRNELGSKIVISVDNVVFKIVPLYNDAEVVVLKESGEHLNTVKIENGNAQIVYADCPDKLCLKHKPIQNNGEIIVCLPNRVVVSVYGTYTEFDAIAG